jgi:hypothetical protein
MLLRGRHRFAGGAESPLMSACSHTQKGKSMRRKDTPMPVTAPFRKAVFRGERGALSNRKLRKTKGPDLVRASSMWVSDYWVIARGLLCSAMTCLA